MRRGSAGRCALKRRASTTRSWRPHDPYTIREWERIGYGTNRGQDPQKSAAKRLVSFARASAFAGRGGEGVLEHGRRELRARGVVGVIAARDCQLEILPKIEGAGESGVTDATLRDRLIHMLAAVYDLKIEAGAITQLGWQSDTVSNCSYVCSAQNSRTRCAGDAAPLSSPRRRPSRSLRGRLDVTRQFSTLAVSPQNWRAGSMLFLPTLRSIR